MNATEIQIRRDICKDCSRVCGVRASINHADPCQGCPEGIYHEHSDCDRDAPEPIRGLGDAIHAVALPIARILRLPCIDPATKKLRPESPCATRRKKMNAALPFNKKE